MVENESFFHSTLSNPQPSTKCFAPSLIDAACRDPPTNHDAVSQRPSADSSNYAPRPHGSRWWIQLKTYLDISVKLQNTLLGANAHIFKTCKRYGYTFQGRLEAVREQRRSLKALDITESLLCESATWGMMLFRVEKRSNI